MSLLERLQEGPRPKGRVCKMQVILASLNKTERTEVEKVMESIVNLEGRYSANWLANQLRAAGHSVNHATILRHANKECCCVA